MGIQINGQTDTISASDGNLSVSGYDLTGPSGINVTGVSTFSSGIVVAAGSTAAPSITPTGDSNTGIFFPSADTIAFGEGGVEAFRIDSSGNVTINNGNLVIGTSGKGIDFSATANSSGTMTSELLSDYEEGTWTPGISGSSGGSYTAGGSNAGWYRKIGKIVFLGGTLHWTAQVTAYSGNLTLTGLPFASNTASNARSGGGLGAIASGLTFTAGYSSWTFVIDPGGITVGYPIQVATGGSGYSHNPTVGTSGIVYGFFGSYATDS